MTRQLFYDVPGGDTILLDIVDETNGYRQPIFGLRFKDIGEKVRYFHHIKNVTCKDDDLLLLSYPKTGTNWLWEMITLMRKNTSAVTGGGKIVGMMEAQPLSTLDEMPSPRILNTHIKAKYIPKARDKDRYGRLSELQDAAEKKLKTILICRNPKDVVVSFYNFTRGIKLYEYEGKFENYLQMFMRGEVDYGSYAEYLLEWQEHIRNNPDVPFHILYYEDLKEDCVRELKRLRDFLELKATDNLLEDIAENCSMKNMPSSKEHARSEDVKALLRKAWRPNFSPFRKGQIGDWKNSFTVAQSEMFDLWWKTQTKGLDMFTFRYE